MKKTILVAMVTLALGTSTYFAIAADEVAFAREIKARQSFMQVYAFNLGILGAMAKGEKPYDADMASAAANNLLAASKMSNGAMWPAGSDLGADGLEGVTWAKPEIWTTYPEIGEKGKALTEALTSMAAVAGDGLDAVRGNMGGVGDGCKGCHESFRMPQD